MNNLSGNLIFCIVIFGAVLFLFIHNLFTVVFKIDKRNLDEERSKQLTEKPKQNKSDEEKDIEQTRKLVETLTAPFVDFAADYFNGNKLYQIQRKLKFIEWDKYFEPLQFVVLQWICRIGGAVIAIVLYNLLGDDGIAHLLSIAIGVIIIILPGLLLNNTYKNKQNDLMNGFPEMINIISGYLSADMLFVDAIRYSLPHMSEHWQPIMNNFVVKAELSSTEDALEWLKYAVDIVPIKEFVSVVKLNLELGNSVKDSFAQQAEKVQDMLNEIIEKKIEKRKMYTTIVQAPLLLCMMLAFALPTLGSLIDLFR